MDQLELLSRETSRKAYDSVAPYFSNIDKKIIDAISKNNGATCDELGSRDKDFQNSIDWDSIMVEES